MSPVRQPFVSIILPTYNRAALIADTIQSVLNQTYKQWELIVVDDGSEDETEKVVRSFECEKIVYHHLPHCGILAKLRNYGIKLSKGNFIAFLDSDDLWEQDKLAFQLNCLSENPESYFILTNGTHFGEAAGQQPPDFTERINERLFMSMIEQKYALYMPSLLFRRTALQMTGELNEALLTTCDVDFIYRMAFHYLGIFTNQRLIRIRKQFTSMSSDHEQKSLGENARIVNSYYKRGMLSKSKRRETLVRFYYSDGLKRMKKQQFPQALANFTAVVKMNPLRYKAWIRLAQLFLLLLFHKTATAT